MRFRWPPAMAGAAMTQSDESKAGMGALAAHWNRLLKNLTLAKTPRAPKTAFFLPFLGDLCGLARVPFLFRFGSAQREVGRATNGDEKCRLADLLLAAGIFALLSA